MPRQPLLSSTLLILLGEFGSTRSTKALPRLAGVCPSSIVHPVASPRAASIPRLRRGRSSPSQAFDKQGEEAQQNAIFGWAQGSRESARYTAGARRKVREEAGDSLIFVQSHPAGTHSGERSKENK